MKICKRCGNNKNSRDYYEAKKNKDGLTGKCKECIRLDVKNNKADYDKTEKGVIRVIYKTQKSNSIKRGHPAPSYTKEEFKRWIYSNGFKSIYDNWVESGFRKDCKPSVDRIDDFKPYSLDNISLVTWLDNRKRQYGDITNGIGTGGSRCKSVLKMSVDGEVVCEYVSYSSAARDVGYSLEYPIKHSTRCKGGFFWAYSIGQ